MESIQQLHILPENIQRLSCKWISSHVDKQETWINKIKASLEKCLPYCLNHLQLLLWVIILELFDFLQYQSFIWIHCYSKPTGLVGPHFQPSRPLPRKSGGTPRPQEAQSSQFMSQLHLFKRSGHLNGRFF